MKLIISPRAEKELKKIPKIHQIAIAKKIRLLKIPDSNVVKEKLSGYKDIFRVRVGQYRIVFRQKNNEIYIVLIDHRKNIYQLLKRLFQ